MNDIVKRLQTALQPFADAVFNDNGEMSITPPRSEAYYAAYWAIKSLTRTSICAQCNDEFSHTRVDAKWCSDACCQKAYRERSKENPCV